MVREGGPLNSVNMLNKQVDGLEMENGRVVGVRSGEEVARCGMVICDPRYFIELVCPSGLMINDNTLAMMSHQLSYVNSVLLRA